MNVKEKLANLSYTKERIEILEGELISIDTKLQRVTQRFDVNPSGHKIYIDELIINAQALKDEINKNIDIHYKEFADCIKLLDLVNGKYKTLLYLRYISRLPWHIVAQRMNYSVSQSFRIHGEALKRLNTAITNYESCE